MFSPVRSFFACLCLATLLPQAAFAAKYYVSPSGSDAGPGTQLLPWRTLQKAADSVSPGDTVYVRNGVYSQTTIRRSGSRSGGFITFRNQPGHKPIIDGTGATAAPGGTGLIHIRNRSYIIVQGFEIRNFKTSKSSPVPMGVFIEGSCQEIQIRDCDIHHIETLGNSGNAFGIAVYGTSSNPSSGIVIDNNEVHHMKVGTSETVAINGNVSGFKVTNNRIHDTNNIALVFIGYEKSAPKPAIDQARDGICSGNEIWNVSTEGNRTYPKGDFSAGGIYCDGSSRILIERNIVHDCDIGVELASEHPGKFTSRITLRNNFVYFNRQTGLYLGGYAKSGTGGTRDCTITGNTFFGNDTLRWEIGEAQIRSRTFNCSLRNNIFSAGNGKFMITVPVSAGDNVNNRLDYNLYDGAGGASRSIWKWNRQRVTGFPNWKSVSGQDAHSLFENPRFVKSGAKPDLHLRGGSPAINAGDPGTKSGKKERDIDGDRRKSRGRVDIGADEKRG